MKKSLKEYTESFDLLLETKMFSKEDCDKIINILIKRKDQWENRSPIGDFFNTYGALTYLDKDDKSYAKRNDPNVVKNSGYFYESKLEHFNKILEEDLKWMYDKIKLYYEERLNKPIVFKKALPAFHIFKASEDLEYEYIKNLASIHVDAPEASHEWDEEIIAVSSFTVAIELPKCTAGLNVWLDDSMFNNINTVFFYEMNSEEQSIVTKHAKYFPYKQGYVYEQDGSVRHQITCGGNVFKGERRITLQGHLVETNNEIIIYV